jgi:hypothetical protein
VSRLYARAKNRRAGVVIPSEFVATVTQELQPISDLDLMIRNGWGDTPQTKIPADWRTRTNRAALGRVKPGREAKAGAARA